MNHRSTMWATMKPYCYGGDSCAEIQPQWDAYASGDKDSDTSDCLKLAADTFPPGTKVTVEEPVCPNCDLVPSRSMEKQTFKDEEGNDVTEWVWSCGCDFDWREWALTNFS